MQKRLGLDLEVPDEFGIGLAWYVTGEGCFAGRIGSSAGYRVLRLAFEVGIRSDDLPGLKYIQETLGVGKIYHFKKRREHKSPTVHYRVSRIGDLYHVIVPLFEKYPLPSQWRKSRDFDVWKQLVELKYREGKRKMLGGGGSKSLPQSYWDKVESLVAKLKQTRQFSPIQAD